jgi:hypothetical protein
LKIATLQKIEYFALVSVKVGDIDAKTLPHRENSLAMSNRVDKLAMYCGFGTGRHAELSC